MTDYFDEILIKVLEDDRTKRVPILFVVQVLLVMEDLDLLPKENLNV